MVNHQPQNSPISDLTPDDTETLVAVHHATSFEIKVTRDPEVGVVSSSTPVVNQQPQKSPVSGLTPDDVETFVAADHATSFDIKVTGDPEVEVEGTFHFPDFVLPEDSPRSFDFVLKRIGATIGLDLHPKHQDSNPELVTSISDEDLRTPISNSEWELPTSVSGSELPTPEVEIRPEVVEEVSDQISMDRPKSGSSISGPASFDYQVRRVLGRGRARRQSRKEKH